MSIMRTSDGPPRHRRWPVRMIAAGVGEASVRGCVAVLSCADNVEPASFRQAFQEAYSEVAPAAQTVFGGMLHSRKTGAVAETAGLASAARSMFVEVSSERPGVGVTPERWSKAFKPATNTPHPRP